MLLLLSSFSSHALLSFPAATSPPCRFQGQPELRLVALYFPVDSHVLGRPGAAAIAAAPSLLPQFRRRRLAVIRHRRGSPARSSRFFAFLVSSWSSRTPWPSPSRLGLRLPRRLPPSAAKRRRRTCSGDQNRAAPPVGGRPCRPAPMRVPPLAPHRRVHGRQEQQLH